MLANLRALFGVVVDIILLRRGPEHLPASPALLGVAVAVNVVLYGLAYYWFMVPKMQDPPGNWFLQIVAGAVIVLLWFRFAFQLTRKLDRFTQTMIAVFAINTAFIAAMPLVAVMVPYLERKDGPPPPVALMLFTAIVGVWVLVVLARIVRSAFEWPWVGAFLFVLASNLGTTILVSLFFGSPQKPA